MPGLAAGTYYYRVTAEDAAGNVGAASNQASVTVSTAPPVGLVAAYSFDQGSGTVLTDLSGSGNHGAISGPTWTGAGKYGGALTFDGVNDIVNVPDSPSLDLSSQHDARSVDPADGARQHLADGPAQGAVEQLRLRPLRQHGHGPAQR